MMRNLLVLLASVLAVPAMAAECIAPGYATRIDRFTSYESLGSIGFSLSASPTRVEVIRGLTCYKMSVIGRRLFLFANHRSHIEQKQASFLAVQIVKTYKNLRFSEHAHALRTGSWERDSADLTPVLAMRAFRGISASSFAAMHGEEEFDEQTLQRAYNGEFWHAVPSESTDDSRKFLSYWSKAIPAGDNVQVENFLIRFETVPDGDRPLMNRLGVPFSTFLHADLDSVEVRIHSPVDSAFRQEFFMRF